ncbi:hypothetical protein N7507_010434 [Penicillium longicatenatum]|nr:hypothetical protein N7507_010434 [Penicillium longicatenatum]
MHLKAVHETLVAKGVVQLQLGFEDVESKYLQNIITNLHLTYNHGLPVTHSAERGWFWDVRRAFKVKGTKLDLRQYPDLNGTLTAVTRSIHRVTLLFRSFSQIAVAVARYRC